MLNTFTPVHWDGAVCFCEPSGFNALLEKWVCVCNGLSTSNDLIKKGNEKVLKARFADAQFFIEVDRSASSSARREQLKKVTFADGLGTLFNRVERMEWLADLLLDSLKSSNSDAKYLRSTIDYIICSFI